MSKPFNGERKVSSTNGAGKTGSPHAKEWSWTLSLHLVQKLTQMDETPKCKS